ncbi:MAG: hypothetical protein LBU41_05845 [Clostridiales Family XIII bacterium]|nr:hypothetical protein [Clostridiales Family XIII bacterium]
MRKRIHKIGTILVAFSLVLMLSSGHIQPVHAADQGLVITGYEIYKGDTTSGSPYTGAIQKGDKISLVLHVSDDRITSAARATARTNSASFSTQSVSTPISSPAAFDLTFPGLTYSGTGNSFKCDISYITPNKPTAVERLSLDISQCVEYVAPPAPDPAPAPSTPDVNPGVSKTTSFVLKSSSYGTESVYAGTSFTLSATLLATNGQNNVENVTITILPPKEISLQDGASLQYIGTVGPGQNIPITYSLSPGIDTAEGSYSVQLSISGVNAISGEPISAQAEVAVPILQPERFSVFSAQLPEFLTAGFDDGSGYGSITLVNQGRGTISNVSAEIIGDGLTNSEGKQYVGHIAGGEQKTVDFTIMADEPGEQKGKVRITYENIRGEQKELFYEFVVQVEEGMDGGEFTGEEIFPEETQSNGKIPVWVWILIGLAVATAAFFTIRIIRKKRAAAKIEDESFDLEDE